MEKQQFKLEDSQIIKCEKKDLYKEVEELYIYYHNCYKQFQHDDKITVGTKIDNKISNLLYAITNIYFNPEKYDNLIYLKNIYVVLKQIEFHIRAIYKMHIIQQKKYENLSKLIAELSNSIKGYKEKYFGEK